jgi:hypothetical protein
MKKSLLLFLVIVSFAYFAKAQVYTIKDGTAVNNDMARPCITVEFEPDAKEAGDQWKSFLKKKYDFKLKSDKKDDLISEACVFPAISPRTMDFITRFEKNKETNTTKMNVFVSFGYDVYVNKTDNPSEYNALMNILKEFSVEFLRTHYNEKLSELNDELLQTEKNRDNTIKSNEDLANTIEKNKQTIIDLTKQNEQNVITIENNKKAIETLNQQITVKKEAVLKLSNLINGIN